MIEPFEVIQAILMRNDVIIALDSGGSRVPRAF